MSRSAALEHLQLLMLQLKEADTDGMAMTTLKGALETSVGAGGADDARVREAARLIVRAERVAAVRFYIMSNERLLPLISRQSSLDQLVAPAEPELSALSPRRTASGRTSKAFGAPPLATCHPSALPAKARKKVERAASALLAEQWDSAANLLDEAREMVDEAAPAAALAAAAAIDVLYAFALTSDPDSRDRAEAWDVVQEYTAKVSALQLACEPLLLLVLARLEHGGIGKPSALRRQRSGNSFACLALFAHKSGVNHASAAEAPSRTASGDGAGDGNGKGLAAAAALARSTMLSGAPSFSGEVGLAEASGCL